MSVEHAQPTTPDHSPPSPEPEGVKLRCSIKAEHIDEALPLMKKLVGKKAATTTGYVYSTARLTDAVQDNLETAIENSPPRELLLTPETLTLWLRARMGTCSKKRKEGEASEKEDGAALLGDDLANLMHTALVASALFEKSAEWLEEGIEKAEERIDALSERESAQEKIEKIMEIKEEMEELHSQVENQSSAHSDMLESILTGDMDGVKNALQDGEYQLDIGEDPAQ